MLEAVFAADRAVLLFLQELRSPVLTAVLRFFTHLGDSGAVWIALCAVLLLLRPTRRGGVELALSLAVTAILCNLILKPIIARDRPFLSIEELELIVPALTSYSFPSGHASSSLTAAMTLTLVYGRRGAWAFLPAVLIAFSRMYVGIHYPSDVIVGALLGCAVAWAVHRVCRCWERRRRPPGSK